MERTEQLLLEVGDGDLEGRVVVDQPYAQDQHETLSYKHVEGGKARYLGDPLFASSPRMMERLAANVLHGSLTRAMAENMEDLVGDVFQEAPFEFGDLKASGHPIVKNNGVQVYDRPPLMHRLSEADLEARQELRRLGLGHNSWENPNEI